MQVMEATTRVGCKASIGSLWCDCGASEEDGLVGWEANVFGAIPASLVPHASPAYGVYGHGCDKVVPRLAFPRSLGFATHLNHSRCTEPHLSILSVWHGEVFGFPASVRNRRLLPWAMYTSRAEHPIRMVPIVVPAAAVTGSNDRWAWSAFVAGGAQG